MNILLTTLNSKFIHSNLALKYLKGACNKNDIKTKLLEFTINNSSDYIFTELIAGEYQIVCFSCYIWNIEKTLHLCENLKKAKPETIIILGGPEVSFDPSELMNKYNFIDYIMLNEGEDTIVPLFNNIIGNMEEQNEKLEGIAYKENGEIIVNPKKTLLDFNTIPFPYEEGFEANKVIYYESTRGCPYNCSYCMSSIDKKVRALNVDRVKSEMKYFLDNNVKQVKFLDRTFNWNIKRANDIWQYLIENDNGKTNFHFELCADNIHKDTLDLIKNARKGLFQFEIGIQSTNQKTLDAVNRTSNTDMILENVKEIITYGNIHIHVDLIAGLPYEDYNTFRKSFNDVFAIGAEALQLGFLKLLKGTLLRDLEDEHKYIYDRLAPYQVIGNKYISPLDIVKLKKIENILDIYHNRGGYNKSIEEILKIYNSNNQTAFDFFEEFSIYYYNKGHQNRSHKKEDQYRILNNFVKQKYEGSENYNSIFKYINEDLEDTMNFDAVKKFIKKGW